MNPRFEVKQHHAENGGVWFVKDNEAKQYNMPEMAVSIYFAKFDRARQISEAMNQEWSNFLRNPS